MQVLFVLRFYHSDKTDKIDRLIHALSSKMAVKMSSVVKQLLCVLTEIVWSYRLKRFGSCIQSIRFWINNQFLDFSKETHPAKIIQYSSAFIFRTLYYPSFKEQKRTKIYKLMAT